LSQNLRQLLLLERPITRISAIITGKAEIDISGIKYTYCTK